MRTFLVFLAGFAISPIVLNIAAYVFCALGIFAGDTTDPGATAGFFDSPITKTLGIISLVLVIGVSLLSWIMRRRVQLLTVSWMIEKHDRYAKRIIQTWRNVNPDCRRRSISSIKRVILTGHGLEPEMMPKAERKPKQVYDGPRLAVDNEWKDAA